MMNWLVATLTVAQVAHGLVPEMGGDAAMSHDFATLGEGPWVPIDSPPWSGEENNAVTSRSLLGRRELLASAMWKKCGGKGFTGSTTCVEGASCVKSNEWYSQCKPSASNSGKSTSTPRTTTISQASTVVEETTDNLKLSASPKLDGTTYAGDATYYEDKFIGACTQTWKPPGFRTVALNNDQWAGSALCGTCVEGYYKEGYPVGTGAPLNFKAIIDNQCPECHQGDLDFRIDGLGTSDGRWPLEWKIIPCPSSGGLKMSRENGNQYYAKLKAEGGPGPVTKMTCGGFAGKRTMDAFFEFQHNKEFCTGTVSCTVEFNTGGSDTLSFSQSDVGNFC